ncbi:17489_t:CDS:2 [Funneliformis geosporum]|uniref:17489_t:CDS:1 n=1 Tax=Funneliformis geosporum TaxID=1117311 RepID=A0A9W4WPN1_9GLOM|nr:17489_t:CDS:2 [Funneliformis geosporum]
MLPPPQLLNQVTNFIQERGKPAYYGLFLLGKEAGLRPTNRFSFAHFLQKTKKQLNISANIELTPHTLRRCFATYQTNSGMPLPVLQKIPKKPPKPIENQPQELINVPVIKNHWHIFLNIQQETNIFIENKTRNSQQELLTAENKLLQEKVKQLEQEKREQEQIIINLKNDKQRLEKQLIQVQSEKESLLKLLSSDLQIQRANLFNKEQNNTLELHQQLIAQIQVLTKN